MRSRIAVRRVPVSCGGKYFRLHEAQILPSQTRPGGPPILIGGNGAKQTPPLEARYAREWNANFRLPELSDAGAQRLMLQWLDLDDLDGLQDLAKILL